MQTTRAVVWAVQPGLGYEPAPPRPTPALETTRTSTKLDPMSQRRDSVAGMSPPRSIVPRTIRKKEPWEGNRGCVGKYHTRRIGPLRTERLPLCTVTFQNYEPNPISTNPVLKRTEYGIGRFRRDSGSAPRNSRRRPEKLDGSYESNKSVVFFEQNFFKLDFY